VSLPVRFHPLAEDDLVEAWSWYEAQQNGLGDRLITAVQAALDRVAEWPDSGTPTTEDPDIEIVERRVTTSGFPYAIRYRTIDEVVVVIAVYHQRRRPDFGSGRAH
jgi:toxin ParE1/3/4